MIFRKSKKIHAEKNEELKHDIEEYKELKFRNSKYFKDQLYSGIGLIIVFIFLIRNPGIVRVGQDYKYIEVIYFLGLCLLGFLSAKWNFIRFKRNKEKNNNWKSTATAKNNLG